jgi:hypothetical protein
MRVRRDVIAEMQARLYDSPIEPIAAHIASRSLHDSSAFGT